MRSRTTDEPTDGAMDAALRRVALPPGLFARLNELASSIPDDPADQVDWLGC